MNKELKAKGNKYFKMYPNSDKLYITDDENVFLDKSPAVDHATKTKQKWYVLDNPAKLEAINKEAELLAEKEKADKLVAAEKALKTLDIDQIDYSAALGMVSDLQLTLKDRKAETVLATLSAKKEELTK
ncbi:MAG: hypothetical protein QM503_04545 [Bacteroidota bacterium]